MSTETTDVKTPESTTSVAISENIERLNKAHSTVNKYAMGSMAVGLIPFPYIDFSALSTIQIQMLRHLAKQYEVEFSKETVRSLIASLFGSAVSVTAAASLAKLVPVVGQASGMVSMAFFGGTGTYAVGTVFIEHFESGGTLLNFEPEKVKEKFQALLEEGKQLVSTTADKIKAKVKVKE
jgi:uncharacterized protein (DUF697 family)